MNCETIKMEISANPEFVSIIRLTTSGLANKIGFSIDDIEDIKVAVSEACTNAIKHSNDEKVTITFNVLENGLGLFIIQTLMDDVKVESKDNQGTIIKMTKYLGVDI